MHRHRQGNQAKLVFLPQMQKVNTVGRGEIYMGWIPLQPTNLIVLNYVLAVCIWVGTGGVIFLFTLVSETDVVLQLGNRHVQQYWMQ